MGRLSTKFLWDYNFKYWESPYIRYHDTVSFLPSCCPPGLFVNGKPVYMNTTQAVFTFYVTSLLFPFYLHALSAFRYLRAWLSAMVLCVLSCCLFTTVCYFNRVGLFFFFLLLYLCLMSVHLDPTWAGFPNRVFFWFVQQWLCEILSLKSPQSFEYHHSVSWSKCRSSPHTRRITTVTTSQIQKANKTCRFNTYKLTLQLQSFK